MLRSPWPGDTDLAIPVAVNNKMKSLIQGKKRILHIMKYLLLSPQAGN